MTATRTIEASPEDVFAVLADPTKHPAIDGTGWVAASLDETPLTRPGQVFRMAMYHENHPNKDYEIANQVELLDQARAIAWKPGQESSDTGELGFGGWIWRYDLEANGPSQTVVTLTYDWSGATPEAREIIQFPPFGQDHLDHSLDHLSGLLD
jgi:hypothetical protein